MHSPHQKYIYSIQDQTQETNQNDNYSHTHHPTYLTSYPQKETVNYTTQKLDYLSQLINLQQSGSGLREVPVDFDNRYYDKETNKEGKGHPIQKLYENRQNYKIQKAKDERLSIKYGKQSRMAQIMSIKVRACYHSKSKTSRMKQKFERNQSEKSQSLSINKQKTSTTRDKPSRFDKIMKIKVNKPSVCSTLINYQPKCIKRLDTLAARASRQNSTIIDKQNRQTIRKYNDRTEREQRTWRQEQRQRQLSVRQKQQIQEKEYQAERRKQNIFQKLVEKQMIKIEKQREIQLRQNGGFSKYVYPFY